MPTLHRVTAALAAAALLAACSSSGSSSTPAPDRLPPVAAVRDAATETAAAGSSRFELTATVSVGEQSFDVTASGLFDPATRTGEATYTLPPGAMTLQQRFVGDDLYLQVPGRSGWFRLSAGDLVGTQLGTATDPSGWFDVLEGVSDDVRETGQEEVRGEPTTRYEGTVDAGAALEGVGGAVGDLTAGKLDPSALDAVPFQAWVDEDGRLRRFAVVVDLPAAEVTGGRAVASTTTVELFDFGVAVAVEPPPAEQVQDGAAVLQGLRELAG